MDFMGDAHSMSMNNRRAPPPEIRYTSRSENREDQGRAGSGFEPSLIAEKIREACSKKLIFPAIRGYHAPPPSTPCTNFGIINVLVVFT